MAGHKHFSLMHRHARREPTRGLEFPHDVARCTLEAVHMFVLAGHVYPFALNCGWGAQPAFRSEGPFAGSRHTVDGQQSRLIENALKQELTITGGAARSSAPISKAGSLAPEFVCRKIGRCILDEVVFPQI